MKKEEAIFLSFSIIKICPEKYHMAFFIPIILGYLQEAFRHGYFHSSFSTEYQESELSVTSCGLFRNKFEAKLYTSH